MSTASHISSTFKNASIYAAASIMSKAVGFIMIPIYAHQLGTEGYGIIGMIEVVTSVLGIFVSYGVSSAVNRFFFERKTYEDRNVLISTSIIAMIVITGVICTPGLVFNSQIADLAFGVEGSGFYITLAIFAFMAESGAIIGQQYLLILQRSVLISVLSVFRLIIALSLNIYLIVFLKMGVLGVLYSSLVTSLIFFIFFNAYTLIRTGIHFNTSDAKEIIHFSLPLVPGYIAMFIRSNADRILLRSCMGIAEIGIYSMVMKFSLLIGLFVQEPFMKTWVPKRMEICDSIDGPETISKIVTLHLTMMIFVGLLLSLEIPLLIKILTPREFWVPAVVGFFAVFSRIAFNTYYHFVFGLLYGKKTLIISMIQIAAAILSVPLYYVFIKSYGILGGFVAALIVFLGQCTLSYYLAQPYYRVPYEWKKILTAIAVAVLLFMVINPINFEQSILAVFIKTHVAPVLNKILVWFNLDAFRDGKLINIVNQKLETIIEGSLKGILGILYLIIMVACNILPREQFQKIISKFRIKTMIVVNGLIQK
jgi:O-antigen/teichoic acid export membrane protein